MNPNYLQERPLRTIPLENPIKINGDATMSKNHLMTHSIAKDWIGSLVLKFEKKKEDTMTFVKVEAEAIKWLIQIAK